MSHIYIFGAHSRAQTLATYLRTIDPTTIIKAFLVSNDEKNADRIDGVPVYHLSDDIHIDVKCQVYLGIRGVYHEQVTEVLQEKGFTKITPVTVELDIELRNKYLKNYYEERGREFLKFEHEDTNKEFCIYEVRSEFDKPIQTDSYNRKDYEKGIQVGAALTDKRLEECAYRDNEGENISLRNRQFCEETALYWIWKNAREDIVGLVHYRRHFLLPDNWKERMLFNRIDVILPTPLYVAPSVGENYRFRHNCEDWDYLMEYLKNNHEAEYSIAKDFFSESIFSPCNMFVMRKEVLDEFCEWLFPILFAVAEHCGKKDDAYQNRYPAFMGERLLSLYFEMHRKDYKIVYADKNFLN